MYVKLGKERRGGELGKERRDGDSCQSSHAADTPGRPEEAVGVTRGPMGRLLGHYPEEVSGGQITQGLAGPSQEF